MTGLRVWLHPSSRTVKQVSMFQGFAGFKVFETLKRCNLETLDSSSFRRTASVVRNWRHVANRTYFNSRRSQRAHRRLAARPGTADAHIHAAHPVIPRHVRGIRRGMRGGKGRALARSPEAERSRTLPRQNVAIHVGNGHDRVVEGRLHVAQAMRHMLALLLLESFLLTLFLGCGGCAARCCWFRHESVLSSQFPVLRKPRVLTENRELRTENWFLCFRRRLLLLCDRSLARTLTGTGIRMCALAANRQVAAVAEPAIGTDFDETLDVHRNFLAQIAFHQTFGLYDRT